MKELTKSYGDLLQDKRVRSEQAKYESFTRQRSAVLSRYRKVFQSFNDLVAGLMRAQSFYSELKDTVESLEKNVETFVNNRRSEGAQLLSQIERAKANNAGGQADKERDRLRDLMERMSVDPSAPPSRSKSSASRPAPMSRPSQSSNSQTFKSPTSPPYASNASINHYSVPSSHTPSLPTGYQGYPQHSTNGNYQEPLRRESYGDPYNSSQYPYQATSPPPNQTMYTGNQVYPPYTPQNQHLPHGYVPPPPPPGPPPGSQHTYPYAQHPPSRQGGNSQQPGQGDPWDVLNAWK